MSTLDNGKLPDRTRHMTPVETPADVTEPREIRLTIRPEKHGPDEPDVWVRWRNSLKRLLRTHGSRCVKIETKRGENADG